MGKRKLADELADLFNPAPTRDADPEAFGLGVDSTAADAAAFIDDEQLEAMDIAGHPKSKKAREGSRRMRADIDVDDEQYRGRRSSRAAVFGEEEEEEEEEQDGMPVNGLSDEDEEGEEGEEGDEGEEGSEDEEEEEEEDDGEAPEEEGEGDLALKRKVEMAAGTSRELAELEREYEQLQREEDSGVMGLKQRSDKEKTKGEAVMHQQKLYDRSLELRILLQKALQGALRLPLGTLPTPGPQEGQGEEEEEEEEGAEPSTSEAAEALRPVLQGLGSLRQAALETLHEMLDLQQEVLRRNDAITSQMEPALLKQVSAGGASAAAAGRSGAGSEDCWQRLELLHRASAPYRNSSLDRWHRRTVLMIGGGTTKGEGSQLRALNQSISSQVAAAMREPTKLIQRSRVPADTCPRPLGLGLVPEPEPAAAAVGGGGSDDEAQAGEGGSGGAAAAGGAWVASSYDDGEFYQQLLREFLTRAGAGAAAGAGGSGAGKRRRLVDRRASKGRKVRYQVHEKMVNFMTPVMLEPPAFAAQLFSNLFGSTAGPAVVM